jgi:hypothetical protein
VKDMEYLNSFRNGSVKDKVGVKVRYGPGTDILQSRVAECPPPPDTGRSRQFFE